MRKIFAWSSLALVFPCLAALFSMPQGTALREAYGQGSPGRAAYVDEILEIRRHQGELLQGTLLEVGADAPQKDFAQALERIAAATPPIEPPPLPPAAASNSRHCEDLYSDWIEAEQSESEQLVAALRTTTRWLDRKANDLEENGHFQRADRLRRLAQRMRKEARLLETEPLPEMQ